MGFDYIFFDTALAQAFVAFGAERGVPSQVTADQIEGWVVRFPEDLSPEVEDAIEAEYNRLMLLQRDALDAADGADLNDVLGVQFTLASGQTCWVRVPAVLGRRLVAHFSFEEIHSLVALVAEQVLKPSDAPLCQKL